MSSPFTPPASFIRETANYWVLAEYRSKSSPDKVHEVRTSKNDGKTYCSCLGWVFKARKGDGICKHIAAYMAKGHVVVVMNLEEFLAVKRACTLITDDANLANDVKVKRRKL